MAKKKGGKKQARARAKVAAILEGFGLNPAEFQKIIHRAVRRKWTPAEFESAIYRSAPFRKEFPGIFRPDGSRRFTPAEYRQQRDAYMNIAREFGIELDKTRAGKLFAGEVSPQEFFARAQIYKAVQSTDQVRQQFNQVLQAAGHSALDPNGWFDFLAGRTGGEVRDLYEAASLAAGDIGLDAQQALQVAQSIGSANELANLQEIVQNVRRVRGFVGSELRAEGISEADLATLEGGADPRGIAPVLERILKTRQARGTGAAQFGRRQSQGGTVALFGERAEGA